MLNQEQALALTRQMKQNSEALSRLMKQAWEGKAWVALGYTSISEWLKEGVGVSRARGYQLLAIAKLEERLISEVYLPGEFTISDRATRLVSSFGVEDFIAKAQREAGDDPGENEVLITRLIHELNKQQAEAQPTPVAPEVAHVSDDHEETIINLFRTHAENLPHANEVEDRNTLTIMRDALINAIAAAEQTISNYNKEKKN